MPTFRAYTSRGAVLIWRQSGFELPGTGTAAPRSKWLLIAPRGAAFVYSLPRAPAPSVPVLIDAVTGDASAAGADAAVILATTIGSAPGDAVAAGADAAILLGAAVYTTPGAAVADGALAQIIAAETINAAPGAADADGAPAEIITRLLVAATPGEANADGATAAISLGEAIAAGAGEAVADGADALVSLGIGIDATPGAATAEGAVAQILAARLILATPADAAADGAEAQIILGTVAAGEVWSYVLSNGLTAGETVVQAHAMLSELYRIHGLQLPFPLIVTPTSRVAGTITQTITTALDGTVTVQRV